jgi:hypothetical protein
MSLPVDFNKFSSVKKLETHKQLMYKSKYQVLPMSSPSLSSFTNLINTKSLAFAFLNDTDARSSKQGTMKPIHGLGISAPVFYTPTDYATKQYTGIYSSGGIGFIRLSRATTIIPFTPGLALKIFVDGEPSVNFHAMYSLDGQGNDLHFFTNTFTTKIEKPISLIVKVLAYFFHRSLQQISQNPNDRPESELEIPLLEAGKITSSGSKVDICVAPKMLYFVPKVGYIPTENDFREDIANNIIYPNVIYEIQDENKETVGTISLLDNFIASIHGDNMAFKHQQMSVTSKCPITNI